MNEPDPAAVPSARELLKKAKEAYGRMESYSDRGEVLSTDPKPEVDFRSLGTHPERWFEGKNEVSRPQECSFRSWFRRPDRLRFEWTTHHPYPPLRHIRTFYVIWNGAAGAFLSMSGSGWGKRALPRLSLAVAGATGVSVGSALHFATLFFPRINKGFGSPLKHWPAAEVGEASVEGTPCWSLSCQRSDPIRPSLLLLGKSDFLVRRMTSDGQEDEETRRDIRVNPVLPDALFEDSPEAENPYGG